MKILIEIGHPAHVHFFRNAIAIWHRQGHKLLVVSRDKEMTNQLLDAFNIEALCLSKAGHGVVGLFKEMLIRDCRLLKSARLFKPDVMTSIGGTWISQVGKLINTPTIVFYDTENATISNALTYPLASTLCTPKCYQKDTRLRTKHLRYPGYHELAYLHPSRFTPDDTILTKAGIKKTEPYFVLRFIAWEAGHDISEKGMPLEKKRNLVSLLSQHGRVFITSEQDLPPDLSHYSLKMPPEKIHHLIAFSTMVVGESATMASEAAVLGVPSIFISDTSRGYIDEQEQVYGLVYRFTNNQFDACRSRILALLAEKNLRKSWQARRKRMLEDTIDVTSFITDFVTDHPNTLQQYRNKWFRLQQPGDIFRTDQSGN